MNTKVIGLVTSSPCNYVPKNVLCNIWLNKEGLPIAIHRLDTGAGTFLMSKYDMKNTIWEKN
jgi:hypothetical protein